MEKALRSEMKIVEEPKKPLAMHPKKFAMWLFCVTVFMLFASWTSAYIVRRAEGNWLFFELPSLFYYTTIVMATSSVTMQWAYFEAKKNRLARVRFLVVLTAILGVAFLVGQFYGWGQMVAESVHPVGNPSGSFVYVVTGFHGLHIISAVVYLMIVLVSAIKMRINSGNMAQMEMCTTYWHFLGALWLYLFVFLMVYR
jgi:cytochrome c oxidase subunit 3